MERVAELLEHAIGLSGGERDRYLEQACGGDAGLRREVESLIAAHEQAGSRFLNETPAVAFAAGQAAGTPVRAGRRVGSYLLTEQIGHGGMGEVFAAVRADGQYEKKVALKLVRAGYGSGFVLERFRNERQILAGLDHPNIARLLDGGTTEEGVPYLVMELVDGTPIDAYCDAHRLPVVARLELFRQVCDAVQYAHRHLVIHRDIKPGNILVTPEGTPKLLDFGIAKILDASGETEATMLRPMTPEFASPEQVAGDPVTTATDVYSLGVVLHWLLAGCSPYGAETGNPARLAQAIGSLEPQRPSGAAKRRELRGDLDAILLKALRKEPERRYGSVEQFSDDIRRHLEGLPVQARKGTWSYRAGKFLSRHRTGVAAAALLVATLVAGVVTTLLEARVAEASQRRAEARFNDVRKLANSLLFEINDSIKDVPGATRGRQLILQRSLEYLDRLAAESGNDPALLRELATAYSRVGELQGNALSSNVGDTKAALDSAQKAIRLRESLVGLDTASRADRLELAEAYLDLAELQMGAAGDIAAGFDYGRKSAAMLDREAGRTPDDPRVLADAARAYEMLGAMQIGEGAMGSVGSTADGIADLRKALSLNEHRAKLTPSDQDMRRQSAILSMLLGDGLFKTGDRARALELYRAALDTFTSLDPEHKSANVGANQAVLYTKIGDVLLLDGRNAEAVSVYEQGERAASRLFATEPRNMMFVEMMVEDASELGLGLVEAGRIEEGLRQLRRALGIAEAAPSQGALVKTLQGVIHAWIGTGLERAGRLRDAAQQYALGRKIHAEVLAAGAKDPRMQLYLAFATGRSAAALLKLGQVGAAGREYDQALALLEPLAAANGDDQELLYALGDTYAGKGAHAMRLAQAASAPGDRLAQWQQARGWLQKSAGAWARVSNPARLSQSGFEVTLPDEVARRLARCDAEIAALSAAGHARSG